MTPPTILVFSANKNRLGMLEITTTNTKGSKDVPVFALRQNKEGVVYLEQIETHNFEFNHTLQYKNILRKWTKICISLDFLPNICD